jgi:ribosomal protein L11
MLSVIFQALQALPRNPPQTIALKVELHRQIQFFTELPPVHMLFRKARDGQNRDEEEVKESKL